MCTVSAWPSGLRSGHMAFRNGPVSQTATAGWTARARWPAGPAGVRGVSALRGGVRETPPLPFCMAQSGEWGVGAVPLGKWNLDPETTHPPADKTRLEVSHEGPSSTGLV